MNCNSNIYGIFINCLLREKKPPCEAIYHVIRTSRIRASPTSPPTEPAAVIFEPDGEVEGVTEGDEDVDIVDIMVVAAVLLGNKVETPT